MANESKSPSIINTGTVHIRKTSLAFIIWILVSFWTAVPSLKASGFMVDWQPFTVDERLFSGQSGKKIFTEDYSLSDFSISITDDIHRFDPAFDDKKMSFHAAKEKRTFWDKMRISILTAAPIRNEQHKLPYDAEEEQVSRFINAISSLIYDDSKIRSLGTIGKMLEPQIKFYFEF